MKTFQICGYHKSGKTTTASEMIKRLKHNAGTVASIKDIHFEGFQLDQPNSNTYIHKQAGADPVIARGELETDFLYHHKMEFLDIARKISADWLIVEGFHEFPLPKIICGKTAEETDPFLDRRTFAISGVIANTTTEYQGIPVFNCLVQGQANKLFELVTKTVFPMLPYVEAECCAACGLTCSKMVEAIVQGEKSYHDCLVNRTSVHLKIGEKHIPMVSFVQRILKNSILGVVTELDGWEQGRSIEIKIEEDY
jgi:molybdopterin-guanine dinucleotide biosynthesis protein B